MHGRRSTPGDADGGRSEPQAPPDVLESAGGLTDRLRERWSDCSPRARRRLAGAVSLLAAAVLAVPVVGAVRAWATERTLGDQVSLAAGFDVRASSTTPVGGRVDYFATVRNTGPRTVRVTGVEVTEGRLRVRSRTVVQPELEPGEALRLPLSVVLDCTWGVEASDEPLRGTVSARTGSGREHDLDVVFAKSVILTGMADTLCRLRPGLRSGELSGPVL